MEVAVPTTTSDLSLLDQVPDSSAGAAPGVELVCVHGLLGCCSCVLTSRSRPRSWLLSPACCWCRAFCCKDVVVLGKLAALCGVCFPRQASSGAAFDALIKRLSYDKLLLTQLPENRSFLNAAHYQYDSDSEPTSSSSVDSATLRAREAEARLQDYGGEASSSGALPSALAAFNDVNGPPAFLNPEATRQIARSTAHAAGVGKSGNKVEQSAADKAAASSRTPGENFDISRLAPPLKVRSLCRVADIVQR